MFERYTEKARRVIFFARYEASQFGSTAIETEHLLLGLIREDKNLTNRFLRNSASIESIRKQIEGRTTIREKVATSIDLPLSNECRRILAFANEEAERLNHRHIGTEHLLLGILREEKCVAAEILHERGLRLNPIRKELARDPYQHVEVTEPWHSPSVAADSQLPEAGVAPNAETAERIAEAVWMASHAEETVRRQRPFKSELRHDVWIVTGSAPSGEPGGALFAFILKKDGRILAMGASTGSG